MQATAQPHAPAPRRERLDEGWAIAPEPARSVRPAPVPPVPASRRLSSEEIDDGWFLPDEPLDTGPALLDVNAATVDQLCDVPGIGRLRANRILAARERLGGFARVDDLTAVSGIGAKTLDKLRAYLTVG